MTAKISNIVNNNGNAAANQFVVISDKGFYFQSYNSVVAKVANGRLSLSCHWDYSRTTMKHLYIFIKGFAPSYSKFCSAAAMRKAIANGDVTLIEMNSLNID